MQFRARERPCRLGFLVWQSGGARYNRDKRSRALDARSKGPRRRGSRRSTPGRAPNRARVAAPFPEGNGVAKPVAAHTEAKATLGSSIRESVPGNADDLGRKEAESEVRRPGAAVLEGMPVPARIPFARADTAV